MIGVIDVESSFLSRENCHFFTSEVISFYVISTSNRRQSDKFVEIGRTFLKDFIDFDQDFDFFDLCFDVELTSIRPTISH